MKEFIHLRSSRFPLLPGEAEEMVNEGLVGKALALYLQEKLRRLGRDVPFVCCEDWGWWVELAGTPFRFGVCVYSLPCDGDRAEFCCSDGARAERIWNWRTFGWIETAPWAEALHGELLAIFREDPEVELLGSGPTFP
jgi:hypothetical protein